MNCRRAFLPLGLAAVPMAAYAHAVGPVAQPGSWSAWALDPFAIVPLAVVAALYCRGISRLLAGSRLARPSLVRGTALFVAGYACLVLALVGPLDALSDVLFTAHMSQHVVLMVAAAPLLVLAHPLPALLLGLPVRWRRAVVGGWARMRLLPALWRAASAPVAASLVQLFVLCLWHAPALFHAAAEDEGVHAAMHASFFFAALLFWWSMVRATTAGAGAAPVVVLCLVLTLKGSALLGFLFIVANEPIYPGLYPATDAWGLTAAQDQQMAGIVMMGGGLPVYLAAIMVVLGVALARVEAEAPS
jgi:putative membrane protein